MYIFFKKKKQTYMYIQKKNIGKGGPAKWDPFKCFAILCTSPSRQMLTSLVILHLFSGQDPHSLNHPKVLKFRMVIKDLRLSRQLSVSLYLIVSDYRFMGSGTKLLLTCGQSWTIVFEVISVHYYSTWLLLTFLLNIDGR